MGEETFICYICHKEEIKDAYNWHSAWPIARFNEGYCCRKCFLEKVLPKRMGVSLALDIGRE